MEAKSEHPLAKALVAYAKEQEISCRRRSSLPITAAAAFPRRWMAPGSTEENWSGWRSGCGEPDGPEGTRDFCQAHRLLDLAKEGKTPLLFLADDRLLGAVAVADQIKPESPQAIREMKDMGIEVVTLTGDRKETAEAIGKAAGVSRVIAGVLPDGKGKGRGGIF